MIQDLPVQRPFLQVELTTFLPVRKLRGVFQAAVLLRKEMEYAGTRQATTCLWLQNLGWAQRKPRSLRAEQLHAGSSVRLTTGDFILELLEDVFGFLKEVAEYILVVLLSLFTFDPSELFEQALLL